MNWSTLRRLFSNLYIHVFFVIPNFEPPWTKHGTLCILSFLTQNHNVCDYGQEEADVRSIPNHELTKTWHLPLHFISQIFVTTDVVMLVRVNPITVLQRPIFPSLAYFIIDSISHQIRSRFGCALFCCGYVVNNGLWLIHVINLPIFSTTKHNKVLVVCKILGSAVNRKKITVSDVFKPNHIRQALFRIRKFNK